MSKRLIELATRVRRRVRDPEIIDLCDEALRVASAKSAPTIKTSSGSTFESAGKGEPIRSMEKFDKTAYMRDYMRKKRAEKKS